MVQTTIGIRTEGWDALSFASLGDRQCIPHRAETLDPALLGSDFLQCCRALLDGMDHFNLLLALLSGKPRYPKSAHMPCVITASDGKADVLAVGSLRPQRWGGRKREEGFS